MSQGFILTYLTSTVFISQLGSAGCCRVWIILTVPAHHYRLDMMSFQTRLSGNLPSAQALQIARMYFTGHKPKFISPCSVRNGPLKSG